MRTFGRGVALALVLAVVGACAAGVGHVPGSRDGSGDIFPGEGAGEGAEVEADQVDGTDAGGKVAPDTVADTTPDAAVDATPDGAVDTTPDTAPEAAPDTAPEAAADAATDSAADSVADSVTDTIPDSGGDAPGPPARVVAMGDLHGDLEAARSAFRLAGVVDSSDHWIGGTDVVVQTGDVLDRWFLERELMDWMEARRLEAVAAGGDVVMVAGNHEQMNLEADYRYVDPGACPAFQDLPDDTSAVDPSVSAACRKRAAAFLPGGTYAMELAKKRVAAIVGDSVFVHGGLLSAHVASPASLDGMNSRWRAFAQGEAGAYADDDIRETMWDRSYSDPAQAPDCASLATVLSRLDVAAHGRGALALAPHQRRLRGARVAHRHVHVRVLWRDHHRGAGDHRRHGDPPGRVAAGIGRSSLKGMSR